MHDLLDSSFQGLIRGGVKVKAEFSYQLQPEVSTEVCIPQFAIQTCLGVYDEYPKSYVEIYAYYQVQSVVWCEGYWGVSYVSYSYKATKHLIITVKLCPHYSHVVLTGGMRTNGMPSRLSGILGQEEKRLFGAFVIMSYLIVILLLHNCDIAIDLLSLLESSTSRNYIGCPLVGGQQSLTSVDLVIEKLYEVILLLLY